MVQAVWLVRAVRLQHVRSMNAVYLPRLPSVRMVKPPTLSVAEMMPVNVLGEWTVVRVPMLTKTIFVMLKIPSVMQMVYLWCPMPVMFPCPCVWTGSWPKRETGVSPETVS